MCCLLVYMVMVLGGVFLGTGVLRHIQGNSPTPNPEGVSQTNWSAP